MFQKQHKNYKWSLSQRTFSGKKFASPEDFGKCELAADGSMSGGMGIDVVDEGVCCSLHLLLPQLHRFPAKARTPVWLYEGICAGP